MRSRRAASLCASCLIAALAGPASAQSVRLNEIYVSPLGPDVQEFVELRGPPGASLAGVVLCVVDGDSDGAGKLDLALDLSALALPADGLLVLGDAGVPGADVVLGAQDVFENGSQTWLLLAAPNPAAVTELLGTAVFTSATTTLLPGLGTLLDAVALSDGGGHDRFFDGAPVSGPDLDADPVAVPAGILRDSDWPGAWCNSFLDDDAAKNELQPRTPGAPNSPCNAAVKITEFLHAGPGGDFVEITNLALAPGPLVGWSLDDSSDEQGAIDLSALGTLTQSQVVVLCAEDEAVFRAHWEVTPEKIVIGGVPLELEATDQLNLFGPSGFHVQRVTWGPAVAGNVDADGISVWPCGAPTVATDNIAGWVHSTPGDMQGSYVSAAGQPGSPGKFYGCNCGWTDAGGGLAGAQGVPHLMGAGKLLGGEQVTLMLSGARANASCTLVMGFSVLYMPFKGGVIVAAPDVLVLGLTTGPAGELTLEATWPDGLPSALAIHYQAWIVDPSAPQGLAGSNAAKTVTP